MVTATQLSTKYDFHVEKVPLVTTDGIETTACAIVRRDTNQAVSVVSSDYQLIPHRDVVDAVEQVIESLDLRFNRQIAVLKNGARLFARYTIDNDYDVGDADFLKPTLILRNSYDRTCGVILDIGFYRVACANGMVVGDNLHRIHTRHYLKSTRFDVMQKTLVKALSSVPELVESYRRMRDRIITMEEFNSIVDETKEKISRYRKKQEEFAQFCLRQFRQEANQNLWGLYNVLTYYVTHRMKNEPRKFSIYQHIDRTARRF